MWHRRDGKRDGRSCGRPARSAGSGSQPLALGLGLDAAGLFGDEDVGVEEGLTSSTKNSEASLGVTGPLLSERGTMGGSGGGHLAGGRPERTGQLALRRR